MKNLSPLLLRLFLIFIVFIAVIAIVNQGPRYLFKGYFDSDILADQESEYLSQLNHYVLNPIDVEKTVAQLEVTEDEIEFYRNYYGTLSEQVENIQQQYEDSISTAKAEDNQEYLETLVAERDKKIATVKKNFEDDQYVIEKIKVAKEKAVRQYAAEFSDEKQDFLQQYGYFSYTLKNLDTDELVESNNSNETKIYKKSIKITPQYGMIQYNSYAYVEDSEYTDGGVNKGIPLITTENTYNGEIYIPKSAFHDSDFYNEYKLFSLKKYLLYALLIVGIVALGLLCTSHKIKNEHFEALQSWELKSKKWPLDVHVISVLILFLLTLTIMGEAVYSLSNIAYYMVNNHSGVDFVFEIIFICFIFALFSLTIILGKYLWNRLKQNNLKAEWNETFLVRFIEAGKNTFLNRSIGVQTFAMFIVFFLAGFGLFIAFMEVEFFVIYLFLFVAIFMPVLFVYFKRIGYLNKIMKQTEDMAQGRLANPIKVKGYSPFANHAESLNALLEGVKVSVQEQAKSERLKTELITNVSHDLRTPLTSIITYTDLLKNPDLPEDERAKYVGILDNKAERLRVLIEDLFEVSKMASGNVELVRNKADLAQLLQQVAGEHLADFQANALDLRISIANQPIWSIIDGQKMYRVLDNLLINALKYSLEGTRVYIHLSETNSVATLSIKNISKYELNLDATELVERFKRADLARNTEGSGLGLAIATSIVELHGGKLAIEADADLFKITITIPTV